MYAGRPEEAIPVFQKVIRVSPSVHYSYTLLGTALRMTGRYEEAVPAYKKAIQLEPNNISSHIGLAGTYSLMGREKEARAEATEVLRINPKFSVDSWKKSLASLYKDQSETEKIVNSLRKAGLK
jgi:adenylate cyclase